MKLIVLHNILFNYTSYCIYYNNKYTRLGSIKLTVFFFLNNIFKDGFDGNFDTAFNTIEEIEINKIEDLLELYPEEFLWFLND